MNSTTVDAGLTVTNETELFNITTVKTPVPHGNVLQEISVSIKRILLPALCVVGITGNILTLFVLGTKKNRRNSTAIFLICLAVSDTLILMTGSLSEWIVIMWNFDIRSVNGFLCKSHVFLAYYSLQISSWILVFITIERTVSILVPHKVKLWCSRKHVLTSVLCLVVVLTLLNGHFLIGLGHEYNPFTMRYCAGLTKSYIKFVNEYWSVIDLCITFAIPFCVIFTGNAIIIIKLASRSRKRKHIVASEQRTNSLTSVLLLLNTTFIISMGPSAVYMIIFPYLTKEGNHMEVIYFLYDMVNLLAGLNATLNFVLYFLSGSRFREEVKAVLFCRESKRPGIF